MDLEDLRLMDAMARSASLSAAARALNVTPPALSMRLKRLEARLGLGLAVRSAHRMSLTVEGETLAAQAAHLLGEIERLPDTLQRNDLGLAGRLRVAAPFGFGRRHVGPVLAAFAAQHPALDIHLDLLETPWPDRREADVVIHIGAVRDSSWIAHVLAPNERWLCASPSHVADHRLKLAHPRDVLRHACICIRENEEDVTLWHFRRRAAKGMAAGRRESLRITPRLTSNDGEVARLWCEQGLGLILRSQWDAAPAVAAGRLVRLLPGWMFDSVPIVALVPHRKGSTARVRALIDSLRRSMLPVPPWQRRVKV